MLGRLAFWHALVRTLLLQAAWNFERMQHIGFCYVLLPMLRLLWRGEALSEAVRRHYQFFNTHPYFAPVIIGAVTRLEEDWAQGRASSARHVNTLKLGLMGSLGAVGDSLFWAALRPFSAWMAIIIMLLGQPGLGIIAFLVLYNVPHFLVRFGGAGVGYVTGLDIVRQLRKVDFPNLAQKLKAGAMTAAFTALPLLAWSIAPRTDARVGAVLLGVVVFALVRKGTGGTRLAFGYLGATVFVGWIWTVLFGDPQ